MQYLNKSFTMDVGVNTAVASWGGKPYPMVFSWTVPHLGDEAIFCGALRLAEIIDKCRPDKVFIESVEMWEGSLKSLTATKRGNLFRLAYLVGAYLLVVRQKGCQVELVPANKWKGQLTKEATAKRVFQMTGIVYGTDHVTDAVGIGLALANRKEWGL